MKISIFCFIFAFGLAASAYCGQTSKITLNDGSVIEGEVVTLDNGTYTLNSGSLGKIKVEATKIRKIEAKTQNPAPEEIKPLAVDPSLLRSGVSRVQQQMNNDPEIMKTVSDLAGDPDFQEAMKDPELVRAAKSQDVNALMKNEKFMNLIKNAKIKQIEDKLQGGN